MNQSSSGAPRTVFVIPTYNEALNIVHLLEHLCRLHSSSETETAFLVVDNGSRDGTAQLVREFGVQHDPRVHLLEGTPVKSFCRTLSTGPGPVAGLGDAYVQGFDYALNKMGADILVQMDADFSHPPDETVTLLAALREQDADVVIGSRYVPGGRLDGNWSAWRRFQSRLANKLAQSVGGLREVADCTAGFKAIRARALRRAGFDTIRVHGYLIQPVLLHRLLRVRSRMVEVPIYFHDRIRGKTKLDILQLLQVFADLILLYTERRRAVRE